MIAHDAIDPSELNRLDGLLARFDLAAHRERLIPRGRPCVSLTLCDPPDVAEPDLPPVPLGASKVGGEPDLPFGSQWPRGAGGCPGFFLQIALRDLPPAAWNPLPRHGMLYLFCHDDRRTADEPPGWELWWHAAEPTALRRVARPTSELCPAAQDSDFLMNSVARPLTLRPGTDFPAALDQELPYLDDPLLARFEDFRLRAANPGFDTDLAFQRGPFFHRIGQLLGHADPHCPQPLRDACLGSAETARPTWRLLLRLESNPATGYQTPSDSRPVYLLAADPGHQPWIPTGPALGC